jgi:hypothetical protein
MHGEGLLRSANGDTYFGSFVRGKYHGRGIMQVGAAVCTARVVTASSRHTPCVCLCVCVCVCVRVYVCVWPPGDLDNVPVRQRRSLRGMWSDSS